MKLLKSIIRPNKVDEVKDALAKLNIAGMTVTGPGIASGTTISTVLGTTITLSTAASTTVAGGSFSFGAPRSLNLAGGTLSINRVGSARCRSPRSCTCTRAPGTRRLMVPTAPA